MGNSTVYSTPMRPKTERFSVRTSWAVDTGAKPVGMSPFLSGLALVQNTPFACGESGDPPVPDLIGAAASHFTTGRFHRRSTAVHRPRGHPRNPNQSRCRDAWQIAHIRRSATERARIPAAELQRHSRIRASALSPGHRLHTRLFPPLK